MILSALVAFCLGFAAEAFASGEPAQDFSLRSLDGQIVKLSDYTGKAVLVNFWATWCGPCMVEMPHLERLQKKYQEAGLVVLSVTIDDARSAAQVKALIRRNGYTFPVLLDVDGKVVTTYNPQKTVPYTLLVDRDGRIAHSRAGYNAGDEVSLEAEVRALLGLSE